MGFGHDTGSEHEGEALGGKLPIGDRHDEIEMWEVGGEGVVEAEEMSWEGGKIVGRWRRCDGGG